MDGLTLLDGPPPSPPLQLAGTEISLSELSRIYPTPPSVESMEEKYEEGAKVFGEDRLDHHGLWDGVLVGVLF